MLKIRGCRSLIIVVSLVLFSTAFPAVSTAAAGLPPGLVGPEISAMEIPRIVTSTVDHDLLKAEDHSKAAEPGVVGPARFAVGIEASIAPETAGRWDVLSDGWELWRVEIDSPGALSLNLRFEAFDLPSGSSLWLHDPDGAQVRGPYGPTDRDSEGGLSTPVVLGDRLIVELVTPPGRRNDVALRISRINHGYRFFGEKPSKGSQGSCNIDVVCPEGDGWRDQIRSVARYTIDGMYLCTGTLVNNTAEDDRPLFLTADHCEVRDDNDNTVVVYWNYESPTCGDLSGGSLSQSQVGSTFLATWDWDSGSDFTLVELDDMPDPAFNVYYAGWDAGGDTPQAAVAIHHPKGGEKSISFENDPLGSIWGSHWVVNDWDLGTTEPGSSGACLFDAANGLCVGTLSGGYAACDNDLQDWFGKIAVGWNGGGDTSSRLSNHLDPLGLGVTTLQGRDPGGSTPTGAQWLIPAAASAPGYNATNWKTQIGIANPSSSSATARLFFVAKNSAWPGVMLPATYVVPAGGAVFIDDPLASYNPTSGLMYVVVDSDEAVVSTRTYNLASGGATFGQGIPGIPLDTASAESTVLLPLIHSVQNQFHTNLGIVQTSAGSILVRVEIHSPSGTIIASKNYSQTAAFNQINDVFGDMGVGYQAVEGGWISVELIGGSPSYWTAYASVVDDRTGDPTYVLPVAR